MELAREEKCEFMPFLAVHDVSTDEQGRIVGVNFFRNEQNLDSGEWVTDKDQEVRLKCKFVISAFGSNLSDDKGKYINYNYLK